MLFLHVIKIWEIQNNSYAANISVPLTVIFLHDLKRGIFSIRQDDVMRASDVPLRLLRHVLYSYESNI